MTFLYVIAGVMLSTWAVMAYILFGTKFLNDEK
ncbi:hypothetical protein J2S06_002241 [Bacillus alveayuensis]|jgi:hypothetical protein|uniref:Uncharacterized protein n=1 Tax=Aeribacillus alveayuensis TaxID=279215 RepID=A0ABT9VQ99_9BACI|nr:hypothetical protein [Bacillus alveayuensis]